jgi:hypothetical protein
MTAAPLKPPFRADQVGGLLRPAHLSKHAVSSAEA